jgi:hypothetical protein
LPGGQSYRVGSPIAAVLDEQRIEPMDDPKNDATRRHVADLVALIGGKTPRHAATLPSFEDGARAQEVLEASLNANRTWAQVKRPGSSIQLDQGE